MKLSAHIATMDRGGPSKLASDLGISISYLSQMASGKAPISPSRCVQIEQLTAGKVTRKDEFPSDWHLIWPELISPPDTVKANSTPLPTPAETTGNGGGQ